MASEHKSKALERFKHYRQTEEGKKPMIYGRSVKGGGMNMKQVIGPKNVYTLSKNTSGSNGDVHGWKIGKKARKETNL